MLRWESGVVVCEVKNEMKMLFIVDVSFFVKMVWYGSEVFGKFVVVFWFSVIVELEDEEMFVGFVFRSEVVDFIKKDYECFYFVIG